MEKNCIYCGVVYKIKPSRFADSKFCSHECHSKAESKVVELPCKICSKKITIRRSEVGKINTCSKECQSKLRGIVRIGKTHNIIHKLSIPRKCKNCGIEYKAKSYNRGMIVCSKKCKHEWQSKVMTGRFRTIIDTERVVNSRSRKVTKYYSWRMAVLRRDKFTCQICRDKGDRMEAHHIKSFKSYPELRTVLSNGITLCYDCHKKVHSKVKLKFA
jgi:5-methylcytosine-specific restriction endonuclease McrA